ncbi:MAG: ParD-like family protein [Lentisphaerales bacterium]|nr:ParD-like family protein [Lentisphaerales bacterium]
MSSMSAQTVRLSGQFVKDAKAHAAAEDRSIPKQIEYWAKIGRIAIDNPDLPYSFIQELLIADNEESVTDFELTR